MRIAQKLLEDKTRTLKEFYQYSNYNCRTEKYDSYELAKMDLNTLLFILHDGATYGNHGSKKFCCKTGASGLEEPQETSQITLFLSGVARAKPHHIQR